MFSIRTIVVMTAFVAAGLASAAEYLVDLNQAEAAAFVTVKAGPGAMDPGLVPNVSAPIVAGHSATSPWI